MKTTQIIKIVVATLILFPLTGCAYEYSGDGNYLELTRTYISGVAETQGFMLELPFFETTQDQMVEYKIGKLPKQDDVIFIDLVTISYQSLPPFEEQKNDLHKIPKQHGIQFEILDTSSGKTIASGKSLVSELKATSNRKLRRPFILNMKKIAADSISVEAELVLKVQYSINETPMPREMFIVITKRARTL